MEEETEVQRQRRLVRESAERDQNVALLSSFLSELWWRLYEKLLSEGFREEQALQLVIAKIIGDGGVTWRN